MADRALAERGDPTARREAGEYWTYLTDEQRSGRGPQPAKRREPFDTSLLEADPALMARRLHVQLVALVQPLEGLGR